VSDPKISDEDIQAFVDDQLPPGRRAEVIARLGDDPQARRRADDFLRQRRLLRAHATHATGNGSTSALTEQLTVELAARLSERRRPTWWRQAAAAAVIFAVGWGGHIAYSEHNPWRLPSVVSGATKAHQIFAEDSMRPVELPASAGPQLAAWFSDHLGEPVHIPDLRDIGLRFVGGRLLATDRGPMAQMLYEDNRSRRLTLYLSPEEDEAVAEVQVVRLDGFSAGYWKGDSLVYTVVAETPSDQLLVIATEIAGR